MKLTRTISMLTALLISLTSLADIQPVAPGSDAEKVAHLANTVFSVSFLEAGGKRYQIVSLDSKLNGSVSDTTMLLVGDEVGGQAGYEAAFQLTPKGDFTYLHSAQVKDGKVELILADFNGNLQKKRVLFDEKSKTLIEEN